MITFESLTSLLIHYKTYSVAIVVVYFLKLFVSLLRAASLRFK